MVSSEEISRRLEAKKRGQIISEDRKTPPVESTNICPQCQTPNPPTAKFCVGCGSPLATATTGAENKSTPETDSVLTSTTAPPNIPADYKLCPSCNQKNKSDAKFCIVCGHKFEENEVEKSPEPSAELVQEKESPLIQSETVIPPTPETADEKITEVEATETPEENMSEGNIPEIKVPENFKTDEVKPADEEIPSDEDPVLKIKKSKELLDIGAITQEEFDRIKNKYLEMI